jgi:hypothetical protein
MGSYGSYYNAWGGKGIGFGGNRRNVLSSNVVIQSSVGNASRMRSRGTVAGSRLSWHRQWLREEFASLHLHHDLYWPELTDEPRIAHDHKGSFDFVASSLREDATALRMT